MDLTDAPQNLVGDPLDPAGRNVISGNLGAGVRIDGLGSQGNVIVGNYLGTDVTGQQSVGNLLAGLYVNGAPANQIGGPLPTARNLISGNLGDGLVLHGNSLGTKVQGNFLGTDPTGQSAVPNGRFGAYLTAGASGLVLGGTGPGEGNLLSGNDAAGVAIDGAQTLGNQIVGNRIGTDATGRVALGNMIGVSIASPGNTVGGTTLQAANLISGNVTTGVLISGASAVGNVVTGNLIGTDVTGTRGLGNNVGLFVNDASDNRIGGDQSGEANLVSGNGAVGIYLFDRNATRNVVQGNHVGTDPSGTQVVARPAGGGSQDVGILLNDAPINLIGGDSLAAGNLVSGQTAGIVIAGFLATGNAVRANTIGTDASGTRPLPNQTGLYINGSPGNTIGGTTLGASNLISGNPVVGLTILGQLASGNLVQGNFLGTDRTGTFALPNGSAVYIENAPMNTIGGTAAGAGNLISGNRTAGVYIFGPQSLNNVVQGNAIGPRASGMRPIGNGEYGVLLYNAPNNVVTRSGSGRNQIVASGIGNFREFSGPAPRRTTGSSASTSRSRLRVRTATTSRSLHPRIGTALKIGRSHPAGPLAGRIHAGP